MGRSPLSAQNSARRTGRQAVTRAERDAIASAVRWAIHRAVMPDTMTTGERVETRRRMQVAAAVALRELWEGKAP